MEYKVGWTEIELGQICSKIADGTHHTPEYTKTGVPFISVKDIYDEKVNFDNCKYVSYETHRELIKRCNPEPNDLLITKSGTIGRMAIVPNKPEFSLFVSVALLKNNKSIINTKFLLYSLENYLNSINISQDIKGGLLKNYHLEDIRTTKINLVPFPEQRAIVSKIEQLFSELDNGIANLKLAQEQLKVYRHAVLKKAFEGELTKKWREQQTDLPDAKDLLEQIREKNGKTAKVSGNKIKTESHTENELAQLPKVPTEWRWVKLEDIGEAIDPQPSHRTPKVLENGIPYVGVGDIDKETDKFDFNNARKVSPTVLEEHLKRYSIDEGDFIIGKIGTIGKPFLIPIRRFYALSANVVLVKPNDNYCLKKYMFYLSKSQIIEKQFLQGSKATTQAAFGIQKVRILNIPLCSLSEQQVIVSEIETRLSVCEKIEQDIETNLEKAEALRQSILKKAFEGKLLNEKELAEVREAKDWEPAEVLLERIKAEKAGNWKK